jgi:hypothetical protein
VVRREAPQFFSEEGIDVEVVQHDADQRERQYLTDLDISIII